MTMRKPAGWRKIVGAGNPMPLFKKVIAKMDTQEIAKHKKLSKDYVTSSEKLYKAWEKARKVPLAQQKKLKELIKAAEMLGQRAEKVQDRYDEFYKKMMKKYYA
jgi:hypothetical protein